MKNFRPIAIIVIATTIIFQFSECCQKDNVNMKAPLAKKIKKEFKEFENTRIDNYYWLNDRENQEVIDYLKAENSYTEMVMKETEPLQEKIYNEIVSRIKQTDMSVPYRLKEYEYYTRYEEGKEYPIYCRKKLTGNVGEEIMLNGNEMAKGHAFFQIGDWEISYNNEFIAYSVDTVSRRKYTIHFKNLKTGEVSKESIPNTSGGITWANDNKTVYYTVRDETLRPSRIFKHSLGSDVKSDKLIFHEEDVTFSTYIYKTKSDKFLVIGSSSTLSDEYRVLGAFTPDGDFNVFQPRQNKLEYGIDHQGDRWLVRTNHEAKNFRLMETPEAKTTIENWKEVIPNRAEILLEGVDVFEDFYVLSEREKGLPQLRVFDLKNSMDYYVEFNEEDYYAYTSSNPEFKSNVLRFGYTSLKTPTTIYDFDMITKEQTLMKQYEVLGGYEPDKYITERIYAPARDGALVPVSIVYRKDFKRNGSHPLMIYGYGSYGYSIESRFRSSRLSLLDRGFALAFAHIRGGQELGRQWYEDGKLLNKKNTFFDFIDCAEHLVDQKYTSKNKLFALGGSAGGLLVGAVINYEPELFRGVIAAVPFVDVMTTMFDESIPLTTGEYDEWGDPNVETYYNYMLSYSPYDNVEPKAYPNMLVTTGLHDSQVQYWEPAKWVAKLREMKTDKNILLLKTNMDFGHGGASGRFERYKETALEDAFMLKLLDINE